jgi:hypothetical protein
MQFNSNTTTSQFSDWVQYSNITALSGFLGGIDNSDVPFVYHHLRKGCILTLNVISGIDSNRQLMYGVTYGSYRIGVLSSTMARRIQQIKSRNLKYRLTVSGIEKEKYLPPTAIKVELEWERPTLDFKD